MVKHPLAQVGGHAHCRAEKADAPQKPPDHHQQHNDDHRQADVLEQHLFGESDGLAADNDLAQIDAVDDQPVQPGDHKLDVIDRQQCQQPQQQHGRAAQVVTVDVLAEDHGFPLPFPFAFCTLWQNSRIF